MVDLPMNEDKMDETKKTYREHGWEIIDDEKEYLAFWSPKKKAINSFDLKNNVFHSYSLKFMDESIKLVISALPSGHYESVPAEIEITRKNITKE